MTKWPWVGRRYVEQLEKDIEYRDNALLQMRRERDAAVEQAKNATDELIMRLGCAPITSIGRARMAAQDEKAGEVAKQFAELMNSVDAENHMIDEELSN